MSLFISSFSYRFGILLVMKSLTVTNGLPAEKQRTHTFAMGEGQSTNEEVFCDSDLCVACTLFNTHLEVRN